MIPTGPALKTTPLCPGPTSANSAPCQPHLDHLTESMIVA